MEGVKSTHPPCSASYDCHSDKEAAAQPPSARCWWAGRAGWVRCCRRHGNCCVASGGTGRWRSRRTHARSGYAPAISCTPSGDPCSTSGAARRAMKFVRSANAAAGVANESSASAPSARCLGRALFFGRCMLLRAHTLVLGRSFSNSCQRSVARIVWGLSQPQFWLRLRLR